MNKELAYRKLIHFTNKKGTKFMKMFRNVKLKGQNKVRNM